MLNIISLFSNLIAKFLSKIQTITIISFALIDVEFSIKLSSNNFILVIFTLKADLFFLNSVKVMSIIVLS